MLNKKIINGLKAVCFMCLMLLILSITQKILENKFKYPTDYEDHLGHFKEFEQLEKDTVDVISVGTSHVMYGVSPMEVYKNQGITLYNLAGSAQNMELSYLLLKKAFKTQTPKVVLLDVSSLFIDDFDNAPWRKTADNLSLDQNKIELAKAYANEYTGMSVSEAKTIPQKLSAISQKSKAACSILFPLYYYHNRWKELNEYDVTDTNEMTYIKGYYMSTWVTGANSSIDDMNEVANAANKEQEVVEEEITDGKLHIDKENIRNYSTDISARNVNFLMQIKELCAANNAQLILFKIPSVSNPRAYAPSWTKLRSDEVKGLAVSMDLKFLDLLYDIDIHMDMTSSFSDAGGHLNYKGAKTVSEYIGYYLAEECSIEAREDGYYDSGLPYYNKIVTVADLQMDTAFEQYMDSLYDNRENLVILMSVNADASWISDEQYEKIKKLGAALDLRTQGDSYVLAVDQGIAHTEILSGKKIDAKDMLLSIGKVNLTSSGNIITADKFASSSIQINGKEYAENAYGLNIVVVDCKTGLVIDSVDFYPNGDGSTGWKRTNSHDLLKSYEHAQYELEK